MGAGYLNGTKIQRHGNECSFFRYRGRRLPCREAGARLVSQPPPPRQAVLADGVRMRVLHESRRIISQSHEGTHYAYKRFPCQVDPEGDDVTLDFTRAAPL